MAEFPGKFSFWLRTLFGGSENIFKEYARNTCMERGYSGGQSWDVSYGFQDNASGNLNFHVDKIFEKFKDNLRGYDRSRRWAQTAADKICPDNSGGSGSTRRSRSPSLYPITMSFFLSPEMEMNRASSEMSRYSETMTPQSVPYNEPETVIFAAPVEAFWMSRAVAFSY